MIQGIDRDNIVCIHGIVIMLLTSCYHIGWTMDKH
jgi:hypothetical protein